jgi:hypothetical protein
MSSARDGREQGRRAVALAVNAVVRARARARPYRAGGELLHRSLVLQGVEVARRRFGRRGRRDREACGPTVGQLRSSDGDGARCELAFERVGRRLCNGLMLALLLRGGQLGNDILGRERFDLPLELQRMAICHPQSERYLIQEHDAGGKRMMGKCTPNSTLILKLAASPAC